MRFASSAVVVLATLSLLATPACRRRDARSAANEMARLQSPDPDDRKDAADDLRDGGGPPAAAVPALIAAVQREHDTDALRAELMTLGYSGALEARPVLEAHLGHPDEDVRKTAIKALSKWQERAVYMAGRYRVPYAPYGAPPPQAGPRATADVDAPPPPAAAASDGCDELAQICGKDPFDVARCHKDLASTTPAQRQAWADCINALSTEPCQKANDKCLAKVLKPAAAPKK